VGKRRLYLVEFEGKPRLINAGNAERAGRHIIDGELAKVRADKLKALGEPKCANAADVAAFYKNGGKVEEEGEFPVESAPAEGLLGKLEPEKGDQSTAEGGHGGH
jgi:hypothetical protein